MRRRGEPDDAGRTSSTMEAAVGILFVSLPSRQARRAFARCLAAFLSGRDGIDYILGKMVVGYE